MDRKLEWQALNNPDRPLQVFISSPGDVGTREFNVRGRAREIVEKLSGQNIAGKTRELVPLLWEGRVPKGIVGFSPQEAVDYYTAPAREVDIYIGIFWTRVGSPVSIDGLRHESGTMYEFVDACRSRRRSGTPKMLLFRCTKEAPEATTPEESDQQRKVEEFFGRSLVVDGSPVRFQAFCSDFATLDEFGETLEQSLRSLLEARDESKQDQLQDLFDGVRSFLTSFEELIGEQRPSGPRLLRKHRVLDPVEQRGAEDTPLAELFIEQGNGKLLLLGEAGSGKTFEMLTIMWELLETAEDNRNLRDFPVPVYLNLASWANCYRPETKSSSVRFDTWAENELVRRYAVSRRVAHRLVREQAIIYCLEGLDELTFRGDPYDSDFDTITQETNHLREACVKSINGLINRQSETQVFMCCQERVYHELTIKPALGNPVLLEPLQVQQILGEMSRWETLTPLSGAIQDSLFLQGQCGSPLLLRLMCVAYGASQDKGHNEARRRKADETLKSKILRDLEKAGIEPASVEADPNNVDQWQLLLTDRYVQRCHPVELSEDGVTARDIKQYLSWIAVHLEPDFLLEDLQPSLLSDESYGRYRRRCIRIMSMLLFVSASVTCSVAIGLEWWLHETPALESIACGLAVLLSTSIIVLVGGVPAFGTSSWVVFGVVLGIVFAAVRTLVLTLSHPAMYLPQSTFEAGVEQGLLLLPFLVAFFCVFGWRSMKPLRRRRKQLADASRFEILPLENINWTWFDRRTYWGGYAGILFGAFLGATLFATGLGIARSLVFGAVSMIVFTLFAGFSGSGLRISLRPNQGIERSLNNANIITFCIATAAVVACCFSYGSEFGIRESAVNAVLGLASTFTWLMFGGIPVVRHVCLGMELNRAGATPSWWCWRPWRRTVRFLDQAVQMSLLRRSAGGYMFRHGLLRRYFRSLYQQQDAD